MRITIRLKMILTFTLIILFLVSLSIYSIITLKEINAKSTVIETIWLPGVDHARTINTLAANYRIKELQHIIATDKATMDQYEKEASTLKEQMNTEFSMYGETLYSDEDKALFKSVQDEWNKYLTIHDKVISFSSQMKTNEAMALINGESKKSRDTLQENVEKLVKFNVDNAVKSSTDGDTAYAKASKILFFLCIFAIVLSIFSAVFIFTSTIRPIGRLRTKLKDLAERGGDLTQRIDISSKDEIGDLAQSANAFINNIRSILAEVNSSAEGVDKVGIKVAGYLSDLNSYVEDTSATVEELAAGTEETAAAAEEVNASSHEIQSAILSIAEKAQEGSGAVKKISERAGVLKVKAIESQQQANTIYEGTKEKLENALKQSEAVNQINVLSDAILQISSQTNLLALNAAIEAARAGEAGKGFAVVADEIRKLAEDSKNTVNEIQKVTREVVSSVNALAESSGAIMTFVDTTVRKDYEGLKTTGEQYNNDAEFVNDLITDFSATSEELSASIESVITAINDVSKTVNEGAAGNQLIAGKATTIVEKVNLVKQQMEISSENTLKLKAAIGKFTI